MVAPLTMQRIHEYAELILHDVSRIHTDAYAALVEGIDAVAEAAGKREVGDALLGATTKPASKATPASITAYAFEQLLRYTTDGTRSSSTGYALLRRYRAKAWADFVEFLRDSGAAFALPPE